MPIPSLKSITIATAMLIAGSSALAQSSVTTEPAGKQNNSATPTAPSGTNKTPSSGMGGTSMGKADPSPTASKQNDSKTPLPESKSGGKTTGQRDAEKAMK